MTPEPEDETPRLPQVAHLMLAHLRNHPGIPMLDLKEALGIGWGSFYHSFEKLEAAGLVKTQKHGKAKLVYPGDMRLPKYPKRETMTQAQRRVAVLVIQNPGMDVHGLMEKADLSRRMAYRHVQTLIEAGYVSPDASGHYRNLRPTQKLFRFFGVE